MHCPNCKKEVQPGTSFCPYCGAPLEGAAPQNATHQNGMPPQYAQQPNYAQPPTGKRPKKRRGCLTFIIIVVVALLLLFAASMFLSDDFLETDEGSANTTALDSPVQHEADDGAVINADLRERFTQLKGDGTDTVTVMMYIIGSDLESDAGAATSDIIEILDADLGDNVNIVLQTGGCKEWNNNIIEGGVCQRWLAEDGGLTNLMDLGAVNMATPESVTDFITYAAQAYPASRYEFILWDHGGGTLVGYGSDELYPDYTITLPQLAQAFANGGVKFDFIGFDACLMGTIETAYALEPYADYLIASEETEPGTGWYYTDWVKALAENPSQPTTDLAKTIIDSFVDDQGYGTDGVTLSVIELREIPYVYQQLCEYMAQSKELLKQHEFDELSTARANTRAFGGDEYDQIDILHYLSLAEVDSSELEAAVKSAVKYASSTLENAHGLAMYYPYNSVDYYSYVASEMQQYGYAGAPTDYYSTFLSILVGGQTTREVSPAEILASRNNDGKTDYTTQSWYDADAVSEYEDLYPDFSYDEREIVEKDGEYVLELSDDEWNLITNVQQQVLLIDGNTYIDLGSDNVYEFNDDGDLLVNFDYTWVSLDGVTVPFYFELIDGEDDALYTEGFVPAKLNGNTDIEIVLHWDNGQEGYVKGYRFVTDGITPAAKGLFALKEGDVILPTFDVWDMDTGALSAQERGEITVGAAQPVVSYEDIGTYSAEVCFMLTDVYNADFWTQTVIYTPE